MDAARTLHQEWATEDYLWNPVTFEAAQWTGLLDRRFPVLAGVRTEEDYLQMDQGTLLHDPAKLDAILRPHQEAAQKPVQVDPAAAPNTQAVEFLPCQVCVWAYRGQACCFVKGTSGRCPELHLGLIVHHNGSSPPFPPDTDGSGHPATVAFRSPLPLRRPGVLKDVRA